MPRVGIFRRRRKLSGQSRPAADRSFCPGSSLRYGRGPAEESMPARLNRRDARRGAMIYHISVAALACVLLAGCANTTSAPAKDLAAAADAECQSYGAMPGTQVYAQCRSAKPQQRHEAMMP